ncbi:hypothetical protein [Nocardioides sp. YIM 152588]|uniref:hypothetical protein n=1 Tax=Nocardioides sp. YIM 152588 TaxID=3158259 RepID=UPI0032E4AF4A
MSSTTERRSLPRRAVAATTAAGLTAAGLALLPTAPAQAAVTDDVVAGTASWGVSTYLNSASMGRPNPYAAGYGAPAAFDAETRISSWAATGGAVHADGSADLEFSGTSVNFATTSGSWLKIGDLHAELDADGNGTVSGLVSYGMAPGSYPIAYDDSVTHRAPERVDLVDLAGNSAGDRVAEGAGVTWTGLDGTWAAELIDFVDGDDEADSAVPAFPYVTQINEEADRTPSPFSFAVETATPSVEVATTCTSVKGVEVLATGDGFRAVTNPGDAGVYVGVAPAGGLPEVDSREEESAFLATDWVMPSRIVGGAFTSALTVDPADVDPATDYAVYTWQAHAHSNATQDTETPLAIDTAALTSKSPVGLRATVKRPRVMKAGSVLAKVRSTCASATPKGKVRVSYQAKGAPKKVVTKVVRGGEVTVRLPRSKKGKATLSVRYLGNAGFEAAKLTRTFKVRK